ncbi:MAG: hypothetical protein ABIE14_02400 [Patescibacteria group bacterium]
MESGKWKVESGHWKVDVGKTFTNKIVEIRDVISAFSNHANCLNH